MPCKLAIRATLLDDMKMLKGCVENIKEVHSVTYILYNTYLSVNFCI